MRVLREVRKAGFGGVVVMVMVILVVVVGGVGFWGRGEVKMGISVFGVWCGVVCKCWFRSVVVVRYGNVVLYDQSRGSSRIWKLEKWNLRKHGRVIYILERRCYGTCWVTSVRGDECHYSHPSIYRHHYAVLELRSLLRIVPVPAAAMCNMSQSRELQLLSGKTAH